MKGHTAGFISFISYSSISKAISTRSTKGVISNSYEITHNSSNQAIRYERKITFRRQARRCQAQISLAMYREISLVALYNYAPLLFMVPRSPVAQRPAEARVGGTRAVMTKTSPRYVTWWIDTILNNSSLLLLWWAANSKHLSFTNRRLVGGRE